MNKICDGNVKSFKSTVSGTLAPYLDTTVLQVQTIKNKGHNR